MLKRYYTYRILIANSDNIRVERYNPDQQPLEGPSGDFGYTEDIREGIQELHQLARLGSLKDTSVGELGEALFTALFDKRLQHDFLSIYKKARRDQAILRLELDIDERHLPDVAALPWEFMRVPPGPDYGLLWLATAPDLVFSRRRSLWESADTIQLKPGERLRIALAVAEPKDLGEVKYDKIWKALEELARIHPRRVELLDLVNPATKKNIDNILKRKPHIFHFIGHAQLKHENQPHVGEIALIGAANYPQWLKADVFSELFNRHQPGVVVLQACESAAQSASDAFMSVAAGMAQLQTEIG